MRTGIYIHFPFCLRKCLYCDFNSAANSDVAAAEYVAVLLAEMELRRQGLAGSITAPTLYFGGGTPSLMSPQLVGRLIEGAARHFGLANDAEVTLEANPGTLTPEKLAGYLAAGVSRLSLGIQSFEDRLLRRLGRVHTAREAVASFDAARRAGFDNISIDLMHSLPEQSLGQWRQALKEAIALSAEHISAYALSVEAGTPFAGLHAAGKLPLPAEEAAALMFEETVDSLVAAGYRHYEISNFAMPGRESRHNSAYWSRQSYLGFGAGAHSLWNRMTVDNGFPPALAGGGEEEGEGATLETDGPSRQGRGSLATPPSFSLQEGEVLQPIASDSDFATGRRWRNACGLKEYMSAILGGTLPEEETELLSLDDAVSEAFFLGLRRLDGLDLARLESRYGSAALQRHLAEAARLEQAGLLIREGSLIRLAPSAVILANTVFSRFL